MIGKQGTQEVGGNGAHYKPQLTVSEMILIKHALTIYIVGSYEWGYTEAELAEQAALLEKLKAEEPQE